MLNVSGIQLQMMIFSYAHPVKAVLSDQILLYKCIRGWGNGTVVSVSVYEAGHPGSYSARSACFRKVEFYQGAIDLFPPVLTNGLPKAVHVV